MSTSTFSYAQAAKGQSAAQTATSQPSPNQSQTPSISGNQNRDANITNTSTRAPSVAVSTSSNDIDSSRSARSASVKPDVSAPNGAEASQDDANAAASVAGSISSSKVANELITANGLPKGTESRGRSINTGSDTGEHQEAKKGRKPKKGKPTEKDAEAGQEPEKEGPPPKVELSEAPVPSVNFWVQRQQAQKAKAIDLPASTGVNSTQSTDSKARSPNSEAVDSNRGAFNGKQGSKRDGEPSRNGTNQGPRRAAPRGARQHEKQSEINLLANNPASWPTPETAAVNLKTQPQAQPEKQEKEEKEDGGAAKPKQKKEWVQLPDFVPSVKFETHLPGARGPRGGRVSGSRGGRDSASHHTVNNSERAQDANPGSRPNAGSKREGAGPREGRKNVPHADHSRVPKESTSDNPNGEQPKPNHSGAVNGTNHEQSGPASIPSQQPEENVKGSESQKDIKTQNSRDSHPQGQNTTNHRNGERTRGGGRGRGAFNQNNPNGMSHYAQNSYTNQHHAYQFPSNGSRHLPFGTGYPPMPYSFPGQPGPGRKSTNGNRGRGSGRMPVMAPMNVPYDANMYPAPSSGMYPFDAANNHLQLAQSQVEYYFSVENCVKDWYLRTHMDSQGFVPIPFIASFNRMRELLVDLNILRQACLASAVLEIVMGGDGVERVRSKEGWEQWVIKDMNLRDPSARHDGPSTWQQFNNGFPHAMMSPHYPVEAPPIFSPTSEHSFTNGNYGMPPINAPTMNGINGHTRPHESQLSAAVPEFSPSTATFNGVNGVKSASQNSSKDAKAPAQNDQNGVVSPPEQVSAITNGLHTTNGISMGHSNEGH